MQLELFNRKIIIDDEIILFNDLRKEFDETIGLACNFSFKSELNRFKNIDELVEKLPILSNKYIDSIVDEAIKVLVSIKIYDYNVDMFKEEYLEDYFDYSEYYYGLRNLYLKIIGHQDETNQQRQIERSNRSKWQGGGFGVSGAIKGAMTAGALNLGTGIFRGIGDSIVDVNDKSKIRKLKEWLFENEDVKLALIQGMEMCMWGIFQALIDLLSNILNRNLFKFDIKKSEAIFENMTKHVKDKNEIIDGVVQSINLYPYHEEYYEFLIDKFSDPKNEIEKVAEFFGININAYKRINIENYLKQLEFSNEKEAIDSKGKLIKYLNDIGFNNSQEYIKEIDDKLIEFDRQAKEYNGVIYKTRELAELACEEDKFAQKVLEELDEKNKASLLNAKDRIKGRQFKTDIYKEYLDVIEGLIEKRDIEDRTIEGVLYETLEKADLVRDEIELMNKIFKKINKNDINSLVTAKNEINEVKLNIIGKDKYINEINSLLTKLEMKNRTVGGFLFETIEMADIAKKEKNKIGDILKNIDEDDEVMLGIALNKIKALNCTTIMKDKAINEIMERIADINSRVGNLKKDLSKYNRKYILSIMIAIIVWIIGIPIFITVGWIGKIIIGFILLGTLGNIMENNDNRKNAKEELIRIKKSK